MTQQHTGTTGASDTAPATPAKKFLGRRGATIFGALIVIAMSYFINLSISKLDDLIGYFGGILLGFHIALMGV